LFLKQLGAATNPAKKKTQMTEKSRITGVKPDDLSDQPGSKKNCTPSY
jgi:hypothetical protein